MTRKLPVNPAKAGFLADLKALLKQSGSPSYGELAAISKKLPEERDLPTLSTSALSETLNGRRVGLPTSAWVASFVLSCELYAWKVGKSTATPGPDSLPAWHEKLEAAEAAAPTGDEPSEAVSPETPPFDVLSFEPSSADGTADGTAVPGFTLTPSEADCMAGLGAYGQALLAELKEGNPDAAYRVAVVLASTAVHREAGTSLLMGPATIGHRLALALLDASMAPSYTATIGDHACSLGAAADAGGDVEAAVVFYGCAARCCSPLGIVELAAVLLIERGQGRVAEEIRTANGRGSDPAPMRPASP
jgi:hypothetical protein